jgi:ABC-type nitrate/sulfonate/bicarbonate transport system substrate-binding protein/outer membrane protein OmpA-like peptidoglycan-associated protein
MNVACSGCRLLMLAMVVIAASPAGAQEKFSQLVGSVAVKPVQKTDVLQVPFITWGGDVATFYANGGLTTQSNTIFAKQGLKIKLTPGDDFIGQVKDYLSGKSPFLRGTYRMLGQASEVLGSDPRTKPVVVLQLSWSAGDHIVARDKLKTLNDLKGKRIACQQGGPHVGLLYDSLAAAQLSKNDVTIVWTKDLTGPEGAAEAFRKDASIDACCVITPDLFGLTGGFDSVGSGAEGTVSGAHVINSTQTMSRSIADVYAVRKDWFDANKDTVKKFVAGYLKATQDVIAMRKEFESTKRMSSTYRSLLTQSQQIFGQEVIPSIEVDGHGLLLDCTFVGLPGQIAFFNDAGNLNGFAGKMKVALDLATSWGYASRRLGFDPAGFDYREIAKTAGVEYVEPKAIERISEAESMDEFFGKNLDENTIVSFTISFEPNQNEFSADRYGAEFARALKDASTFGNARLVIRGHSDPTKTLVDMLRAGMKKGLIKQQGVKPNYRYFLQGKELDLQQIGTLQALIDQGTFAGGNPDPNVTMQAALNLSKKRAEAVSSALLQFAEAENVTIDQSQITPVGAGIADPVIAKPENLEQAKQNMRVEFRIVRVEAEAIKAADFDF